MKAFEGHLLFAVQIKNFFGECDVVEFTFAEILSPFQSDNFFYLVINK